MKRFIGPVITVNNMSADDDRLANRVLFAKVLGPGRGEPKSYPAHCKPEAKQLRAEILRRDGSARPTHWGRDRMVNFLMTRDPGLTGNELADADNILKPKVVVLHTSSSSSSSSSSSGDSAAKEQQRWNSLKDAVRLVNSIARHREGFLDRDKTPCRADLQRLKGKAKKQAWVEIYNTFNDPDAAFPETKEDMLYETDDLNEGHGLSGELTGYQITTEKAEVEFKKLRKQLQEATARWNRSGNGDDGGSDEEDGGGADMDVYSANFKDYCMVKRHGSWVKDYVLIYAYHVFTMYNLMSSVLSDMPEDSTSSSSEPGVTSGGGGRQYKKDVLGRLDSIIDLTKEETAEAKKRGSLGAEAKEAAAVTKSLSSMAMQLEALEGKIEAALDKDSVRCVRLKRTLAVVEKEHGLLLKQAEERAAKRPNCGGGGEVEVGE